MKFVQVDFKMVGKAALWLSLIAGSAISVGKPSVKRGLASTPADLVVKSTDHWLYVAEEPADKAAKLAEARKEQIRKLDQSLREVTTETERIDVNLKMARLYLEDHYAQSPDKVSRFDSPVSRARALYRYLLTRYKDTSRREEMLYFYGVSSLARGLTKDADSAFEELLKKYPKGRYAQNVVVHQGDAQLQKGKYAVSESFYDRIIRKRYAPLLPYAHFKKAVAAYKQGNEKKSLSQFKLAIETKNEGDAIYTSRMVNEIVENIVLPFTDLNLVNDAIVFFRGFSEPTYRKAIETMAMRYYLTGSHSHASTLWEDLLDFNPKHASNPQYEIYLAESMVSRSDMDSAVVRIFGKLPVYAKGSDWYRANNKESIQKSNELFEKWLRKYSVSLHNESKKGKASKRKLAREMYTKYLEFFAEQPQAASIRYNLAEIQLGDGENLAAAQNFFEVFQSADAGKLKQTAITQAIQAQRTQLNQERKGLSLIEISPRSTLKLTEIPADTQKVLPYSEIETNFIKYGEAYLKTYPKAKSSPDVMYELSYLRYRHYDFKDARSGFNTIVTQYTEHANAQSAAYLVLDIHDRAEDYTGLIATCQNLLAKGPSNKAFKANIADTLRHYELKLVEIKEDKGEFLAAAEGYLAYCRTYGAQDEVRHEKALYKAAENFKRGEQLLRSTETLEKFLRTFPKSKSKENVTLQIATGYETIGDLKRSAKYFSDYASQYPDRKGAKGAEKTAALYYWGAGETETAERILRGYAKANPKENAQIQKDLMAIYEGRGATEKVVSIMKQERDEKGVSPADFVIRTVALAEVQFTRSEKVAKKLLTEALKVAEKNGGALRKTAKGREAYAKLLFWDLQKQDRHFYNVSLKVPNDVVDRGLEKALKPKLQLLNELEAAYTRVSDVGSEEWRIASAYKIAAAHRRLAVEAIQAKAPKNLSGPALAYYHDETKKFIVQPYNTKAIQLVGQCLDTAYENHVYSPWVAKCYELGAEIDPETYPSIRTFYLPALQTALLVPQVDETKISLGRIDRLSEPFISNGLFKGANSDRTIAMENVISLYGSPSDISETETPTSLPQSIDYRIVTRERSEAVTDAVEAEKPRKENDPTFAYLNALRLAEPHKAILMIQKALEKEPNNVALHNLKALAYLETGNLTTAEVIWTSLKNRRLVSAAILNNLGVVEMLKGHEAKAIKLFNQAIELENAGAALKNLGAVALKYRVWSDARSYFEQALALKDSGDVTAEAGKVVAQLQSGNAEPAKSMVEKLLKKYDSDPYVRLAAAYFLIDVEEDSELAEKILSDYIKKKTDQDGIHLFQRALREAKKERGNLVSIID